MSNLRSFLVLMVTSICCWTSVASAEGEGAGESISPDVPENPISIDPIWTIGGSPQDGIFSPDGSRIFVSGSVVRVLDARTGEEIDEWTEDLALGPNSIELDPSGTTLITASSDRTVRLWNIETGAQTKMFVFPAAVRHAVMTPDGTEIIAAISASHVSENLRGLHRIDAETGEATFPLGDYDDRQILDMAIAPDGSSVFTGIEGTVGITREAVLWDLVNHEEIYSIWGHLDDGNGVDYSPDGSMLLTGSKDSFALVWDTETGERLKTFSHPTEVYDAKFSPDGTQIMVGHEDMDNLNPDPKGVLWDLDSERAIRTFDGNGRLSRVIFSPDGRYVLTLGETALWDTTYPRIDLGDNADVIVDCGASVADISFRALDPQDGDITEQAIVTGDIPDFDVPGVYVRFINVVDSTGKEAYEAIQTITVVYGSEDCPAASQGVYVAPDGADEITGGSEEAPYRTIEYAVAAIAASASVLDRIPVMLAPGTYEEALTLPEFVRVMGTDPHDPSTANITPTVEQLTDAGNVAVRMGTRSSLEHLTLSLPFAAPAGSVLMEILNTPATARNVVFDGELRPGSTGIDISRLASSLSVIWHCEFKNLATGIRSTDSAVPLFGNTFRNILADGVFGSRAISVRFTVKSSEGTLPVVGERGRLLESGFNRFRDIPAGGKAIEFINVPPETISAQYNDWGVYTDSEIRDRIFSPLKGDASIAAITPFIPETKAIESGRLVGAVLDLDENPIPSQAGATAYLGDQSAIVDSDGLYVFEDIDPGEYSLTAESNGFFPPTPISIEIVGGLNESQVILLESDGTTFEGEGGGEGEAEGDGQDPPAPALLLSELAGVGNGDGEFTLEEIQEVYGWFDAGTLGLYDLNEDNVLQVSELLQLHGAGGPVHRADLNADGQLALSEILRVIQIYQASGYHCAPTPGDTEDGFIIGDDDTLQNCVAHSADYVLQDWTISLTELLRVVQLFNVGTISECAEAEDGFCAR